MPRSLCCTFLVTGSLWLAHPVRAQALPDWVTADSAGRQVVLTLVAGPGAEAGTGTISGHRAGDIEVVVPQGWTVRWNWRNADSTQNHSLVIMAEREKLPAEGGQPAIDGALSRTVRAGLKPGQEDHTTFGAEPGGWYWVLCGVPGHALKGEWIGLRVDPAATNVIIKSRN
jgi:hypothetical protein